jgi:hypothetical protein
VGCTLGCTVTQCHCAVHIAGTTDAEGSERANDRREEHERARERWRVRPHPRCTTPHPRAVTPRGEEKLRESGGRKTELKTPTGRRVGQMGGAGRWRRGGGVGVGAGGGNAHHAAAQQPLAPPPWSRRSGEEGKELRKKLGPGRVGTRGDRRGREGRKGWRAAQAGGTRIKQRRSSPSPHRLASTPHLRGAARRGKLREQQRWVGAWSKGRQGTEGEARRGGGRRRRGERASISGAAAPRPAASPPRAPCACRCRSGRRERTQICDEVLTRVLTA